MRRLLLVAAVLLASGAPGAKAATVFVISGHGFGHGVGMSQYGAYGYALHHVDYRRILRHYYPQTTLGTAANAPVRILLEQAGSLSFTGASAVNGKRLDPGRSYVVTATAGGTDVRDSSGRDVERFGPGALYVSGPGNAFVLGGTALNGVTGGRYRGQLEIAADGGALDAIDVLSLEDYVAGVVPGEVEAAWPLEALKVQAVAARSYALATHASRLFDQYADTRSQEYKGMSGEQPSSTAAVHDTAGQVVLYRGQTATTFFFSTSGGRTEDVQNSMYGAAPEPYLVSVPDPYDGIGELHQWRFQLTAAELGAKLGCDGTFQRIRVLRRGRSPRIVAAKVVCANGSHRVSGNDLKAALGLPDTWFYETRIDTHGARRPRTADFVTRLLVPPLALAGRFDPAPPGRRLTVEQRRRGRFVSVGTATTDAGGSFFFPLRRAGVYRVRFQDTAGPAVRVR